MEYALRLQQGEPRFDALGVLKLGCAPTVPVNDRMLAQGQMGRTRELVFARIWIFENDPPPAAALTAEFEHRGRRLQMRVQADQTARLTVDGRLLEGEMTSWSIAGEDLQGEYWGAVMMIRAETFFSSLELNPRLLPTLLTGNLTAEGRSLSAAVQPPGRLSIRLE